MFQRYFLAPLAALLLLAAAPRLTHAQTGGVGIGTTAPDASAALDIVSSKGVLLPRLTSAQRQAIASPAQGLLVFQTDGTLGLYYYSGLAWVNLTDGRIPDSNGITLSANGAAVSTLAGSGSQGSANGTGLAASFYAPYGVAVAANGTVYVADTNNHLIRQITPAGVVSTLAGSGSQGSANGTGLAASFNLPYGVAVAANGTIYVADRNNHLIRQITPAGVVSTLAGSGSQGSANGTGSAASFNSPCGVAVAANGTVYVADTNNNLIRQITPAGVVSTLAGSGSTGSANGTGSAASFNVPFGVAVAANGTVYVADTFNNRIRQITPAGVVSTLAGSGSYGNANGTGLAASFNTPYGVAVAANGTVYVADTNNNLIRQITPAGVVSTLAGSGSYSNDNAVGTSASFSAPGGVAVTADGTVYVADKGNRLIRVIK